MRIRTMASCFLAALAAAGGPALAEGENMMGADGGSQTIIEAAVSDDGGELVANTVGFESDGGKALIRWSLGYVASKATPGGRAGQQVSAQLDLRARLLRGDQVLVEWPLDYAEVLQTTNAAGRVGVRRQGTAAALHIDQPPPGPQVYRLVVFDAGGRVFQGRSRLQISARTLLVEPR